MHVSKQPDQEPISDRASLVQKRMHRNLSLKDAGKRGLEYVDEHHPCFSLPRVVEFLDIGGQTHTMLMICGVHPMRTEYDRGMQDVLEGAFKDAYGSCGEYVRASGGKRIGLIERTVPVPKVVTASSEVVTKDETDDLTDKLSLLGIGAEVPL